LRVEGRKVSVAVFDYFRIVGVKSEGSSKG
jgi:hypothetical protein